GCRAGVAHVVPISCRNRHQTSCTGAVFLLADTHRRLALDDVDDLITLVPFFGAGVRTRGDRHDRCLTVLRFLQDSEELSAMLEDVDDLHPVLPAGAARR